eukprot:4651936-Amphidinium_carterae.1
MMGLRLLDCDLRGGLPVWSESFQFGSVCDGAPILGPVEGYSLECFTIQSLPMSGTISFEPVPFLRPSSSVRTAILTFSYASKCELTNRSPQDASGRLRIFHATAIPSDEPIHPAGSAEIQDARNDYLQFAVPEFS